MNCKCKYLSEILKGETGEGIRTEQCPEKYNFLLFLRIHNHYAEVHVPIASCLFFISREKNKATSSAEKRLRMCVDLRRRTQAQARAHSK